MGKLSVGGMRLPTAFWSNTIWYLLLSIISLISIVLILYKSNNRKFDIGFGLAVLGTTFHAEFTLLVAFNAYRYFPKIFNDSFLDSVFGNYVSQISVATSVMLAIIYRIPVMCNLIIAGIYFLIDILFVELGVYRHLWYKSWYSFVLVVLSLLVANKWYRRLLNHPNPFLYYLTLYLGARALFSLAIVFKYFFSLEIINKFVFEESPRNQAFYIILYDSMWIIIMMIIHSLNIKWLWKGIFFVFLFIIQYILIKTAGIITVKNGWFLLITLLNIFGSYIAVVVMDYFVRKGIANTQTK
ncbi:MAG: hypothetical protein P4N59_11775 [Negativicutes bacterium]|nr:hypothetical protein [Negativicutes bacterium]